MSKFRSRARSTARVWRSLVIAFTPLLWACAAGVSREGPRAARAQAETGTAAPVAAPAPTGLAATYASAAEQITSAALASRRAYDRLAILCDRFGNRLSGTPQLEAAIAWGAEELRQDGLVNVRLEPVMVPVWVRGAERASTIAPAHHRISLLALGGSVGTPPDGLTADVVVVSGFTEADSLGALGRLRDRIVLYDVPFTNYGETVRYRGGGASNAARHGAVAALVRSVGPISYDTPHTGALRYAEDVPRIPAAAISIESATLLHRMQQRGETIQLHLELGAQSLPDAPSANVVGEIVGSAMPQEVVVIGGHIDSWDVGQGAQDDGVGCVIAMAAAELMQRMQLHPRRTVRVVLFTNEENGLRGGNAYRDTHRAELPDHVAMIETDSGNGRVQGFRLHLPPLGSAASATQSGARSRSHSETSAGARRAPPVPTSSPAPIDPVLEAAQQRALALLQEIGALLEPLGSTAMHVAGSGADVGPSVEAGAVGIGVEHDTTHYFDIHHTWADTFEKVDPDDLARNVASVTVMAYVLADMPQRLLPRAAPPVASH